MTIWCGGMLRSITRNAHAIAVAVTAIVIEGQWFSRKCLTDIRSCSPGSNSSVWRQGVKANYHMSDVLCVTTNLESQCPLWVISGHCGLADRCLLSPQ